jgi:hypothetical protein
MHLCKICWPHILHHQPVSVAVAAIIRVTDHLFRILSSLILYKTIKIKIYIAIIYLFCVSVEDE